MTITAKELADRLHLSPAAVSMALNNKPGVSTQTRKQVLAAADKYGFDFSRISKKHATVGSIYFVIYKKHGAVVDDTPFFSQVTEGILEGCRKNGYKMNMSYVYGEDTEIREQISKIQHSDCIGIILLGTEMLPQDMKIFLALPLPVVLLDTYFEDIPCDCVLINNVQGAYLATSHLIKRTKKQPSYLCSSYPIGNFLERSSGFYQAIRAYGLSSSNSAIHKLAPSVEGAYADMKEIIDSGEALAPCYFADNDLIAIGAMKALKERGYSIPEDIAVVGFDNIPFSGVIEPGLTTIHVPKQYMGEMAVSRLVTLLSDKSSCPVKIEISTRLIERESV